MPWPMRLGPDPRMTTFERDEGSASQSSSNVPYMYGVNDSNSAAQVSMRL
jgi:hypothetical protein